MGWSLLCAYILKEDGQFLWHSLKNGLLLFLKVTRAKVNIIFQTYGNKKYCPLCAKAKLVPELGRHDFELLVAVKTILTTC